VNDDHIAEALEGTYPRTPTTTQVVARVDTLADEVLRLRTTVRNVFAVAVVTVVLSGLELAYLIAGLR
jgi:hypothetical protein